MTKLASEWAWGPFGPSISQNGKKQSFHGAADSRVNKVKGRNEVKKVVQKAISSTGDTGPILVPWGRGKGKRSRSRGSASVPIGW